MTVTPGSAALSEHCDRAYDRLLALCGTRNGPPRWDDIETLLRERERLYLDLRLATKPAEDEDHPDCVTDRECELYDALMGLASHATAHHHDYKQWTQGGVTLEPIVTRALRLSTTGEPKR